VSSNGTTKRNNYLGCTFVILGFIAFAAATALFWYSYKPTPTPTRAPAHAPTNTRIPPATAIPSLTSTPTIVYRPVTWVELVSFISDDHTNWNEFNVNKYNCMDFSIDLVENATKQKIKAWIVSVMFYGEEVGHAFVAFETTDRGIVFIEPQADVPFVNPKVDEFLVDAWQGNVFIGRISSIEYLQCDNDHSGYCDPYTP
jgi:hypothetical protein